MKPITSGQQEQCVTVIKDAARKGGEKAIAELSSSGIINLDNFQRVLGWKGLPPPIQALVKEKAKELIVAFLENIMGIVKLISGAKILELEETDGKETIAEASETFTSGIYGFTKPEGSKAVPTNKATAQVFEMVKDGTYAEIFGGMNNDLNSLCFTESQIIQFVKKHRKWLRTDGYGTFFLYKEGEDFFFVADVVLYSGGPFVFRYPLSLDDVWGAEYRPRIVVPQLALKN